MNTQTFAKSTHTTTRYRKAFALAFACAGVAAWTGCNRAGERPAPAAPEVFVSPPLVQKVTDFEEFTGHIEAKKTVVVRPRVTGKLLKVYFEEGAEVHEGDNLFLIDPEVYQADYDRAMANQTQAQAHLNRSQADYQRAKNLISTKSISQADYDLAEGNRDEAKAAVAVADAAAKSAKISLDFCTVRADISGRISRQLIDPGNIAMANDTPLTTIVSLDPMYAYFDVDENTKLRIDRIIRSHKAGKTGSKGAPANLALSDEKDFPHVGTIQFIDNQLDMTTGTMRFRGEFPNPDHMLSSGLFARVRVPIGEAHSAFLVPEMALVSDQGQKFVYVLGDDKKSTSYRPVQVGGEHLGLREILSGVTEKDKVVVIGLQRLRPTGTEVSPKDMPPAAVAAESTTVAQSGQPKSSTDNTTATSGPELIPAASDSRSAATRAVLKN